MSRRVWRRAQIMFGLGLGAVLGVIGWSFLGPDAPPDVLRPADPALWEPSP